MAVIKNALLRYQVLDKCFRNTGRMYFWTDLLNEVNKALIDDNPDSEGIRRRQLFMDIQFMESEQGWSIPLERHKFGKKRYYRYENSKFSINNQPLNDTEIERIKSAIQVITRFSGAPQFEWLYEIIPQLKSHLGIIKQNKPIISIQNNLDLVGIDFLMPLFDAIVNEQVLNIKYKSFNCENSFFYTIHPYYLKQSNNRWFLLGLNHETNTPTWIMALDRIEEITKTDIRYEETDMDWNDFFDDIIGVTHPINGKVQKIILLFTPDAAPYIITKPIHRSQFHKLTEEGLEVHIKVIPNFELESLILSYGEQVKVIEPQELNERIAQRLQSASALY